ncbi:C40 family peptidase [Nocardioides pantholopis]|uniref:C40 family peptidase n=1 Tax=Nocardioides pantholopis TaxID=2483798 RepID=UPI000FD92010|nr:C40 family peptidase [Nocardioides pantholopis]
MLNGRKRIVTGLAGLALAGTIGIVPSSPAQAEPDIDDVQAQVDRLFHQAEQASERYNDARLELADLERDLKALRADERRQGSELASVREDVADSIVSQYTGQGVSAAGQVLVSDDPGSFLEQLTTMSAYNDLQGELLGTYGTELEALDIRREATEKRVAQVSATEEQMAAEQAAIEKKKEEAESLLDRLKAEEREAILSRGTTRTPTEVKAPAASGRAGAAIQYAMAQVGDAYVYGAAGPSAFDCSGLTMMAWAQAGVSLPHSSSAQFSSGARVAESDLQPGDLVFYYSPISHVGMYIGNGMIVHAANPGTGVVTGALHSMPYVGAVRPG